MDPIFVAALVLALFTAAVGLFHASPRRTTLGVLRAREETGRLLAFLGCALLVGGLFATARLIGWQQGIPVWLGLISCAGVASLFLSAMSRRWHIIAGAAAFVLFGLAAGLALVSGAVR